MVSSPDAIAAQEETQDAQDDAEDREAFGEQDTSGELNKSGLGVRELFGRRPERRYVGRMAVRMGHGRWSSFLSGSPPAACWASMMPSYAFQRSRHPLQRQLERDEGDAIDCRCACSELSLDRRFREYGT
jgi:hypothetical protein